MKTKENKGITLMVLSITIVVLIILAGVGINATIGNKGVLNKTKSTDEEIEKNELYDTIKMEVLLYEEKKEANLVNSIEDLWKVLINKKIINDRSAVRTINEGQGKYEVTTSKGKKKYVFEIIVNDNT